MKLKTVALIGVFVLFFMVCLLFLRNEHNQVLLGDQFELLGYHISILRATIGLVLFSAIVPSIYFSIKVMGLYKHVRSLELAQKTGEKGSSDLDQAVLLLSHGMPGRVLTLLETHTAPEAALLRGRALMALNRYDEALVALRAAFFAGRLTHAGYDLANCLQKLERNPEECLRTILERDPKDAREAYLRLLNYFDHHKQWATCLDLVKEMQAQGHVPPEGVVVAYRYEFFRAQKDVPAKKQIENFQQVLKDNPDFVPANLALGDAYLAQGAVEKGFRVFEQAFQKTHNTVFLDRLEAFYLDQGHPEDAIQVYRQLLVKRGDSLIQFQLGKLYYKLEMLDESFAQLHPLESELGHVTSFLMILSELKRRRGQQDQAIVDLRKLARLSERHREFICTNCDATYEAWQARCDSCRNWDRIHLSVALVNTELQSSAPLYY